MATVGTEVGPTTTGLVDIVGDSLDLAVAVGRWRTVMSCRGPVDVAGAETEDDGLAPHEPAVGATTTVLMTGFLSSFASPPRADRDGSDGKTEHRGGVWRDSLAAWDWEGKDCCVASGCCLAFDAGEADDDGVMVVMLDTPLTCDKSSWDWNGQNVT